MWVHNQYYHIWSPAVSVEFWTVESNIRFFTELREMKLLSKTIVSLVFSLWTLWGLLKCPLVYRFGHRSLVLIISVVSGRRMTDKLLLPLRYTTYIKDSKSSKGRVWLRTEGEENLRIPTQTLRVLRQWQWDFFSNGTRVLSGVRPVLDVKVRSLSEGPDTHWWVYLNVTVGHSGHGDGGSILL